MIIAVTGGSGMIGRLIVKKHLQLGDTVRVLSRKKTQSPHLQNAIIFEGDLPLEKNLEEFLKGADIFYHCAGELRDESKMRAVHVEGTQKLLQFAKNQVKRWAQLSSVGVYGPQSKGLIEESHPYNAINTYEKTKLQSDILVENFCQKERIDYCILRPSNVFGTLNENHFIVRMIRGIQRGRFAFVGKQHASANFIHAQNVAEALFLCGTLPQAVGQTYIVSDYATIEDFVAICKRHLHIDSKTLRLPELPLRIATAVFSKVPAWPLSSKQIDALCTRSVYSTKKIETELGYCTRYSLEKALEDLIVSLTAARPLAQKLTNNA
jgi:nucleoside-diphosphate-sugar epimerase